MKTAFEKTFVGRDYAVETLLNGNVSECITYLRSLIDCGSVGQQEAHEQLVKIKESDPDRYEYIKTKVFLR